MTRALVLLALLIWAFGAGMAVERHRGKRMLRMLLRAHVRATADLVGRLDVAETQARDRQRMLDGGP